MSAPSKRERLFTGAQFLERIGDPLDEALRMAEYRLQHADASKDATAYYFAAKELERLRELVDAIRGAVPT